MNKYLLIFGLLCIHVMAYSQVPFNCTGDFYTSLTNSGSSSLSKVTVDANGNVVFTTINNNVGASVNAIGYRVTDNLIYGVNPTTENLYRIDANGNATFLTNLGSINSSYAYFAGDVTPDGNFLVIIGRSGFGTSISRNLVKIDLNSPTYATTSISLIDAATGSLNSSVYMSDIAFDPITGVLYGYDNNNKRLVTIDMASGGINSSLYPTTSAWLLGAMFFDASGELFGYGRNQNNNTQDDFFYVDINTGVTTFLTTGPGASGNDGCSCPFTVDFRLRLVQDTIRQCEEFDLRYQIVNTTGLTQSGLGILDTLPNGFIITQIVTNPFGGTVNGVGTNEINASNLTAPLGTTTLRVRVRAPATAFGSYHSQGRLTGLPIFVGGSLVSDDPSTYLQDDSTEMLVFPSELGENILTCNYDTINIGIDSINGASYMWNTLENATNIDVTQSNDYILTISNGTCMVSDTINVSFMDTELELGNDTTICIGDTLTLDAFHPNVTYQWQDGSTNATFPASTPGTYWVEITDSINCTLRDSIIIGNHPFTQVDLGADLMYVCDSAMSFTVYPNYTTGGFLWEDGSTNNTFSAATIGDYSVIYTDANTCTSTDTMNLYAPPVPMVNLGIDTILCYGDSLTLDASQPYNRSVVWQDGSTNSTFLINSNMNGTYHVELTDTNGCQAFDTITVLYNHVTPLLRMDTSICFSENITVDGTYAEANISYLWSNGATTPTITVNQDTTYWMELTDSIGCQGSDTFNLFHHPITDLGTDISFVCDSIFEPLEPGVTHGTFLWHDGSTDSIFVPSSQGTYWVEITDTNGCYSTDTVTLVPVTSPIADIGLDTNICIGQTAVLDASTDFIRAYVWQDSSGLATFNAIATGEYIVEVIDSNGCNDFDTAMVWVNEVIPDIGPDTSICDQTQLLLNATQPNMIAYQWQDGSTNTTFSAATGLYHVTLTDTLGCQGSDSINITYRQTADLGMDFSFICDSVTFTLSANIAGTYQWSTGQIDSTVLNSVPSDYSVTITDVEGCISSDTITVTQITYPTVSLGNDTTYCIGQSYLLDATEPFVRSYEWQDGSTNNTLLTNSTGLYHVELIDSFGCKISDSVMVYVNEVIVNLGNDTTICHDAMVIYNVMQPNMTYLWQDGSTNSSFVVTSPGVYSVTVTDTIGCNDSDAVELSEFDVIDLGIDRLFKCDSSEITVIPNLLTGTYQWQDLSTSSTYVSTEPETVFVTYVDANNCVSYDTMNVVAPPVPPIDLGPTDTVICENIIHTMSIFDGVGRSYLWQDGSTNDNFSVSVAGVYYAEITDTNGCTNSDTINIEYFLNEDLDLGNDTLICENIAWPISLNVTNAVRYEWQDGATGADYTIATDGTYWVNAYDITDCPISDTIIVTTEPVPSEILYLPSDTTVCKNNVITLSAYSPNATDYFWEGEQAFYEQNDPFDTTFLVTYPGTYELMASNRCAGITQFVEVIEEDCGCYPFVPTGFTPNNDGNNDLFKVFTNCIIQDYEMSVYDRWGNLMFLSTDIDEGWDGTARGQELQIGVYVWQMRFSSLDERGVLTEQVQTGDVTLVK